MVDPLSVQARLTGLAGPWWRRLGARPPAFRPLAAEALPAPARALLDHRASMTLTLEAHWGERLIARPLASSLATGGGDVERMTVLATESGHLAVALAVIRVAAAAAADADGAVPFGRRLTERGVSFTARPEAFFAVDADALIAEHGHVAPGTRLWGRLSQLVGAEGAPFCQALEILLRL